MIIMNNPKRKCDTYDDIYTNVVEQKWMLSFALLLYKPKGYRLSSIFTCFLFLNDFKVTSRPYKPSSVPHETKTANGVKMQESLRYENF